MHRFDLCPPSARIRVGVVAAWFTALCFLLYLSGGGAGSSLGVFCLCLLVLYPMFKAVFGPSGKTLEIDDHSVALRAGLTEIWRVDWDQIVEATKVSGYAIKLVSKEGVVFEIPSVNLPPRETQAVLLRLAPSTRHKIQSPTFKISSPGAWLMLAIGAALLAWAGYGCYEYLALGRQFAENADLALQAKMTAIPIGWRLIETILGLVLFLIGLLDRLGAGKAEPQTARTRSKVVEIGLKEHLTAGELSPSYGQDK